MILSSLLNYFLGCYRPPLHVAVAVVAVALAETIEAPDPYYSSVVVAAVALTTLSCAAVVHFVAAKWIWVSAVQDSPSAVVSSQQNCPAAVVQPACKADAVDYLRAEPD